MGEEETRVNTNFVSFLNGTASEEETEALLQWLEVDKKNRLNYFKEKRIWQESALSKGKEKHVDQAWERLQYRIFGPGKDQMMTRRKRKPDWKIYAVAASFAVLLVFGLYYGFKMESLNRYSKQTNKIVVPFGSRSSMVLPDGSKVWLNSGSELYYNVGMGKGDREVTLVGEAYFDIQTQRNSSFIVHTANLEICALGTQFNVKSYPDDQTVETVLIKGKVVIDDQGKDKSFEPVTLIPQQKMTFVKNRDKDRKTQSAKMKSVSTGDSKNNKVSEDREAEKEVEPQQIKIAKVIDPQTDISWKEEKLVIQSESLRSMSRKLERFYNVEIVFQDQEIKDYEFSGTLDEVTIDEVMRAISSTAPISFTVDKNRVTLRSAN